MTNSKDNFKKFTVQSLLNQTPWNKRKETKQEIIALLGISISTFNRIIYAEIGDSQDISSTNMLKLARYFEVKPEDIVNNEQDYSIGAVKLAR